MKAIIVDDDKDRIQLKQIREVLKQVGVQIVGAEKFLGKMGAETFQVRLDELNTPPDLAIIDYRLEWKDINNQDWTGKEVSAYIRAKWPEARPDIIFVSAFLRDLHNPFDVVTDLTAEEGTTFVLLSGGGDWISEFEAKVRFFCNRSGFDAPALIEPKDQKLIDAFRTRAAQAGVFLVGDSATFLTTLLLASRVANTDYAVMLTGETGTGRRTLARAIHESSAVAHGTFKEIVCGEIIDPSDEVNVLRCLTNEGTLYLSDLDQMRQDFQARLAKVVNQGSVQLGNRNQRVHARLISSSSKSDAEFAAAGFRERLFAPLRRYPLEVPPLTKRGNDVVLLAQHILERGGRGAKLTRKATKSLRSRTWPDNVQGLDRTITAALVNAQESTMIDKGDLPGDGALWDPGESLADGQQNFKRDRIVDALQRHGGNKTRAAKELGVTRETVSRFASVHQLAPHLLPSISKEEIARIRAALLSSNWRIPEAAKSLGLSARSLTAKIKKLGLSPNERPPGSFS